MTLPENLNRYSLSAYLASLFGGAKCLDEKVTGGRVEPAVLSAYDMGLKMAGYHAFYLLTSNISPLLNTIVQLNHTTIMRVGQELGRSTGYGFGALHCEPIWAQFWSTGSSISRGFGTFGEIRPTPKGLKVGHFHSGIPTSPMTNFGRVRLTWSDRKMAQFGSPPAPLGRGILQDFPSGPP